MGEIADGLINGDFDFYTGEYLGRGFGYPRTGNKSLPWERGYKKKAGNYGGVVNFCMQKGATHSKANRMIRKYGKEVLGIETSDTISPQEFKDKMMPTLASICETIQKDFNAFREWHKINFPPTTQGGD